MVLVLVLLLLLLLFVDADIIVDAATDIIAVMMRLIDDSNVADGDDIGNPFAVDTNSITGTSVLNFVVATAVVKQVGN